MYIILKQKYITGKSQYQSKCCITHWRRTTDAPTERCRGSMEEVYTGSHYASTSAKSCDATVQRVVCRPKTFLEGRTRACTPPNREVNVLK